MSLPTMYINRDLGYVTYDAATHSVKFGGELNEYFNRFLLVIIIQSANKIQNGYVGILGNKETQYNVHRNGDVLTIGCQKLHITVVNTVTEFLRQNGTLIDDLKSFTHAQ